MDQSPLSLSDAVEDMKSHWAEDHHSIRTIEQIVDGLVTVEDTITIIQTLFQRWNENALLLYSGTKVVFGIDLQDYQKDNPPPDPTLPTEEAKVFRHAKRLFLAITACMIEAQRAGKSAFQAGISPIEGYKMQAKAFLSTARTVRLSGLLIAATFNKDDLYGISIALAGYAALRLKPVWKSDGMRSMRVNSRNEAFIEQHGNEGFFDHTLKILQDDSVASIKGLVDAVNRSIYATIKDDAVNSGPSREQPVSEDENLTLGDTDTFSDGDSQRAREKFADMLGQLSQILSENDQKTLILFGDGYSYEDIAAIRDESTGAVKQRLYRARKRIDEQKPTT